MLLESPFFPRQVRQVAGKGNIGVECVWVLEFSFTSLLLGSGQPLLILFIFYGSFTDLFPGEGASENLVDPPLLFLMSSCRFQPRNSSSSASSSRKCLPSPSQTRRGPSSSWVQHPQGWIGICGRALSHLSFSLFWNLSIFDGSFSGMPYSTTLLSRRMKMILPREKSWTGRASTDLCEL